MQVFALGATAPNPATGDFRSAAIAALTTFTGDQAKATLIFDQGVQSISDAAADGVKPYIYAALGGSALALALATWALVRTRRSGR